MTAISAIVMDIEGTTAAGAFVARVLVPYARERMPEYVRRHRGETQVSGILEEAAREGGVWTDEAVVTRLCQWLDAERTATPLEDLQGLIWAEGYRRGELVTPLYPDVAPALRDWHARGIRLYLYSSSSAHAQGVIFGHTVAGDLTPLLAGYFDTRVGNRRDTDAYRRIAAAIGAAPRQVLLLSGERPALDAARTAGWHTLWLVRDRLPPLAAAHRRATRFDQVLL